MKKINQKVQLLTIFVLLVFSQTACKHKQENTRLQCELSEELKGSRFSVYYIDKKNPILKGDLTISEDLESWQFIDDSDSEQREIGQLFTDFEGSLMIQNENQCKTGSYTLVFEDLLEKRVFKLIKCTIDSGFGTPIYSYDFEAFDPKNNSKEYYRFNKE